MLVGAIAVESAHDDVAVLADELIGGYWVWRKADGAIILIGYHISGWRYIFMLAKPMLAVGIGRGWRITTKAVAIGIGNNTPWNLGALRIEGMDLLAAVATAVVGICRAVVFALLFGIALVGGVVDIVSWNMIAAMAANGMLAAVEATFALVMLVIKVVANIGKASAEVATIAAMVLIEMLVVLVLKARRFRARVIRVVVPILRCRPAAHSAFITADFGGEYLAAPIGAIAPAAMRKDMVFRFGAA